MKRELKIKRFVIRNKITGKFLKGSGKSGVWVEFAEADLYHKKLTKMWWKEAVMELVQVQISCPLADKYRLLSQFNTQ